MLLKPTVYGLHQTERTRLCKWMVYSRATTSAMALRPALGFWVFWVVDMFSFYVVVVVVVGREKGGGDVEGVKTGGFNFCAPAKIARSEPWRGAEGLVTCAFLIRHHMLFCSCDPITFVDSIQLTMTLRKCSLLSLTTRSKILSSRSCRSSRRYISTHTEHDPLRVLFCGADEFSIYSLRALNKIRQEHPDKVASINVVCRKDKRVGRGLKQIRQGLGYPDSH
jgi:hypothetical protein